MSIVYNWSVIPLNEKTHFATFEGNEGGEIKVFGSAAHAKYRVMFSDPAQRDAAYENGLSLKMSGGDYLDFHITKPKFSRKEAEVKMEAEYGVWSSLTDIKAWVRDSDPDEPAVIRIRIAAEHYAEAPKIATLLGLDAKPFQEIVETLDRQTKMYDDNF